MAELRIDLECIAVQEADDWFTPIGLSPVELRDELFPAALLRNPDWARP